MCVKNIIVIISKRLKPIFLHILTESRVNSFCLSVVLNLLVCVDDLCLSQQNFSHFGTIASLSGLNQY